MRVYLKTMDGRRVGAGGQHPPIECFRCGICCVRYQPPLGQREIRALARGLGVSRREFADRYVQTTIVGDLLRHNQDGCVFLRKDAEARLASCAVHKFRPDACRNWDANLGRRECREGLALVKPAGRIVLPGDLYASEQAVSDFARSLRDVR